MTKSGSATSVPIEHWSSGNEALADTAVRTADARGRELSITPAATRLPTVVRAGATELTVPKQRGRPFEVGQSGNPAGRPRGARNKLTEVFLETIAKDFAEHGAEAVSNLRRRDPSTYLRLIAWIVPRDLILQREQGPERDYASMTEDEIIELLEGRRRRKMIEDAVKQTG